MSFTRLFVLTASLFGAMLVFITPPFQSPDEYNHFFRAVQVSEGQFYPEKIRDNRLGGYLPVSLDSLKALFLPLKGNYSAKTSPNILLEASSLELNPAVKRFLDFPNTAIYAPTAYIPQAFGIAMARLFTGRVLFLFFAARLANLLFWIVLIRMALGRMPFQQLSMAGLALLPASLAIASSCNADVITNGLVFFALASFCRAGNIPGAKIVAILAVIAVALNKLVFAPLALLAVLFRDDSRKSSWLPLFLAAGAAIWWGREVQEWFIPYDLYDPAVRDQQTLNPGVNPQGQFYYILEHPLRFVHTVTGSFVRSVPSMAAHVVGKFGWEKNYLPAGIILLLWLALAALFCSEKNPLSATRRLWIAAIALACVILWAGTMYALWCPVGAMALDNWQGRYFTPLLPLLALVVGCQWANKWLKWITSVAYTVVFIGNAMMIMAILQRYY